MNKVAAAVLRSHGIQVTAQRLAVLAAVSGRPHGTADDVAAAVRSEIGVISRQACTTITHGERSLGVLRDTIKTRERINEIGERNLRSSW